MQINPVTGIVTFALDLPAEGGTRRVEFRLLAGMENVAEWQAASGVRGGNALLRFIGMGDAKVIHAGCRACCISGNAEEFGKLPFYAVVDQLALALMTAATWFMPVEEKKADAEKKAPAAAETTTS